MMYRNSLITLSFLLASLPTVSFATPQEAYKLSHNHQTLVRFHHPQGDFKLDCITLAVMPQTPLQEDQGYASNIHITLSLKDPSLKVARELYEEMKNSPLLTAYTGAISLNNHNSACGATHHVLLSLQSTPKTQIAFLSALSQVLKKPLDLEEAAVKELMDFLNTHLRSKVLAPIQGKSSHNRLRWLPILVD